MFASVRAEHSAQGIFAGRNVRKLEAALVVRLFVKGTQPAWIVLTGELNNLTASRVITNPEYAFDPPPRLQSDLAGSVQFVFRNFGKSMFVRREKEPKVLWGWNWNRAI